MSTILHLLAQLSILTDRLRVLLKILFLALLQLFSDLLSGACLQFFFFLYHFLFLSACRLDLALEPLDLRIEVQVLGFEGLDAVALHHERGGLRPRSNQDILIHFDVLHLFVIATRAVALSQQEWTIRFV